MQTNTNIHDSYIGIKESDRILNQYQTKVHNPRKGVLQY